MRKWLALTLFLAAVSLPSAAQAQYPNYYYGHPSPYPYYPAPGYPAVNYYYSQPMTAYPPAYAGSQDRHVILSPIPTTAPVPAKKAVASKKGASTLQPVQQVEKRAVVPAESATPDRDVLEPPSSPPQSLPSLPPSAQRTPFVLRGFLAPPVVKTSLPQVSEVKPELIKLGTAKPGTATLETAMPAMPTDCPERRKCHVMIFGEYLYWNVHGVDVPYAQPFDGIDPIFSVPRGPVGVVSPQYSSGFRVGGGASVSDCVWIVGAFTYFDTLRSDQIAASDGFVLHNFLAFPNTTNSAVDSLTATADYTIRLWMADLDVKLALCDTDRFTLNVFGGARYAHLDQKVFSTFQVIGETTVDSNISFDGIGPRLGLDGQYHIHGGFYTYATGIVDVLFGQFRGRYEERNTNTGLIGLTTVHANRTVPILELELGGGWQSRNGHVKVSGGYYIGSWYNTMTTTSLLSGIGNVNFTTNGNNFRDNMVFDGFVGRLEFRY